MLFGVFGEHDHVGGQLIHLCGDVGDAIVGEQQIHRCHFEPVSAGDRFGLLAGKRERRAQHQDAEADRSRNGDKQEVASPQRHQSDHDHDHAEVGGERLNDDDERRHRPFEHLGQRDHANSGDDRPSREFDRGAQPRSRPACLHRSRLRTPQRDVTGVVGVWKCAARMATLGSRGSADVAQLAEARRLGRRQ